MIPPVRVPDTRINNQPRPCFGRIASWMKQLRKAMYQIQDENHQNNIHEAWVIWDGGSWWQMQLNHWACAWNSKSPIVTICDHVSTNSPQRGSPTCICNMAWMPFFGWSPEPKEVVVASAYLLILGSRWLSRWWRKMDLHCQPWLSSKQHYHPWTFAQP